MLGLHDLVYAIGSALPITIHYRAAQVPAPFVDDLDSYGLFKGHDRLNTGSQGAPQLLSGEIGNPSYGVYAFRFDPAYLDSLEPGADYFLKLKDGTVEEIWTLRIAAPASPLNRVSGQVDTGFAYLDSRVNEIKLLGDKIYDLIISGGGGSGQIGPARPPHSYNEGMVQGWVNTTPVGYAVFDLNYMIAMLHPMPPRLGLTNAYGNGHMFEASYAGGDTTFLSAFISDPNGQYGVGPFTLGTRQLATNSGAHSFRTFGIISGLTAGTILRAFVSYDNVTWGPLGTNWTIAGAAAQGNATWQVYGPGGPGTNLQLLPNGDIAGFVTLASSLSALPPGATYFNIRSEEVVGITVYSDEFSEYQPGGVTGGCLLDLSTPAPSGALLLATGTAGPTRPLSGVKFCTTGYGLQLSITAADLFRCCYGPPNSGSTLLSLVENQIGNAVENLALADLGFGATPTYDAAVSQARAIAAGPLPYGTINAVVSGSLVHPFANVPVTTPGTENCRVITWPTANDTNTLIDFKDEYRRARETGAVAFDNYNYAVSGPFTPTASPINWDSLQSLLLYDDAAGLQCLPNTLAGNTNGVLIYPQSNFNSVGIPNDALGPNYTVAPGAPAPRDPLRMGRTYRTYFVSAAPAAGGVITFTGGLTFGDIKASNPLRKARIELRIPENGGTPWGELGAPFGLPPFLGLYTGSPADGDTAIPFSFTVGIHSTNGSSGDAGNTIQLCITYYDPEGRDRELASISLT